jgi:hypothetical protein
MRKGPQSIGGFKKGLESMGHTVCANVAGDKSTFEAIAGDQLRILRLRPKVRCIHAARYHRDLFRVDSALDEIAAKGMAW